MAINKFNIIFSMLLIIALVLIVHAALAWEPLPVVEDHNLFMPGSQPEEAGTFESPGNCDTCHGGYDQDIEPAYNWRGSMMAHAARDPLWFACLTTANQDSIYAIGNPNAGDICIRCHSPTGWLEGRSNPTNTKDLRTNDFWSVQCDFCHRMLDPFAELDQPDVPDETNETAVSMENEAKLRDIQVLSTLTLFNGTYLFLDSYTNLPIYYGDGNLPNYIENGGGQFFVDYNSAKRGAFYNVKAGHNMYYSRYHKSKTFCSTCHDVSNPIIASLDEDLGIDSPEKLAPSTYYHVERTSSEFLLSAYGTGGAPTNIPRVPTADKCQDCHMRDVTGKGSKIEETPIRDDLPLHDLTGGNHWISRILATVDQFGPIYDSYNYNILSGIKYDGAEIDVTGIQSYGQALVDGSDRAIKQLKMAADLSIINEDESSIILRVQNNGGHKLISGFPEGRRMFLNVKFFDSDSNLIGEINPYEPLITTQDQNGKEIYQSGGYITDKTDELVWEAKLSSTITSEEKTFHFALADNRYKDNRIPPKGFNTGEEMYTRLVQPRWEGADAPNYFTTDEYAGGYDDVTVTKPPNTEFWYSTLYYQTTSKEYVEFLRDEINGDASTLPQEAYIIQNDSFFANLNGWGDAIWDIWLHNGGCEPVIMTQIGDVPKPPSIRKLNGDVVIIPDNNPFFGIIGSYIACWYDIDNNISGLLPLLVQNNGKLNDLQDLFLNQYLKNRDNKLLILGEHVDSNYEKTEILGSPPTVAINAAKQVFSQASTVMIIPYDTEDAYQLGLIASPLASYLNIPILIYDENQEDIINICKTLNVSNAFVIGDLQLSLPNIFITQLETEAEIQNIVTSTIKNQFNGINYITLTNPSDTIPPYVINSNESSFKDNIKNIRLTIFGKEINLLGNDIKEYKIKIPDGINRVKIHGMVIRKNRPLIDKINPIEPIINMHLFDPEGKTVAYSNSFAYDIGETYLDTLTCNASGNYTLVVRLYYGIKGGYFKIRGLSLVNTDLKISVNISTLEKPHMPLIPKLSITAPYITSAHGGLIVAESNFEITSDDYVQVASGSGSGPWFNEKLHEYTNQKVNYTLEKLDNTMSILGNHSLLNNYLNGPAWLAILGGTNMIPMYYYGPSQGIPEKGLPSDNPYSLDWNLSVGRVIGWNVQDVSLLISRTLFYQDICGNPKRTKDWHNRFSFIFGEGFGETGGIFHQIPYSFEIRKYGFKPRIFGDFRNSRQMGVLLKTYTGSNYIEYLGHGDWYWLLASIYGLDSFSKAIDVAHVKDWIFDKPSIFLSSACLMGRIDGLPPEMNIGLTFLHSGCNAFVGANRETGSEASLEPLENYLIVDDLSIGEAFRGGKRLDQDLPTYYVRTLFGDPAFNPYEPNNGFSNQGRPTLK